MSKASLVMNLSNWGLHLNQDEVEVLLGFKEGKLNEFIWIGIYSEKRIHEYTPWPAPSLAPKFDDFGGQGREYIEFVVNGIKLYIDKNYNTKYDKKKYLDYGIFIRRINFCIFIICN